jgi:hypothetical protein
MGHAYRKFGPPGFPVELGGFAEFHAAFHDESRIRGPCIRPLAGNPGPPDFLWSLVALPNFMRLSMMKAAYAALA